MLWVVQLARADQRLDLFAFLNHNVGLHKDIICRGDGYLLL